MVDRKQSQQIAQLQKAVANLKVGKARKKKSRNGGKAMRGYDPIHTAIRAKFLPFDTEKGVASPLTDGRPSQKFMSKAQSTVSLTSGQGFVFMVCPNVASDSTRASLLVATGNFSAGAFTTDGTWKSATVGDKIGAWGSLQTLNTNTPYTAATLAGGYEFACVGSGVKFTYEGPDLYKGGTIRYIYDKEGMYNLAADWSVDTPNGVINYINASANSIRQNINKNNVVEINTSYSNGYDVEYYDAQAATETAAGVNSSATALVGGSTASTYFGTKPTVIGYYVNVATTAVSFHVDVVEHWSLSHPDIQALQTPSYAHASMATHVASLMDNVRQNHAGAPNSTHLDVTKTTMAAMKSPIGHELLNAGIRAALL